MASVLYWKGGTGRMGNPANWEGPGVEEQLTVRV